MSLRTLRYGLRSGLRWRRGAPRLRNEGKDGLFAYLPLAARQQAHAREAELRASHDLAPLHAQSSRLVYRSNLAVLDVLLRLVDGVDLGLGEVVRAVDVGAQDWRYAFALDRFLRAHASVPPRVLELTGVEIDGHVVYPNLHARCDMAAAYAAQTGNPLARYVVADFRQLALADLDVVTMLFPFLTLPALQKWGLPDALFDPPGLIARACAALRPGGWLLLVHQTSAERDVAFELLARCGARVVTTIAAATDLVHDPHLTTDRCATLARCR